MWLFLNKILEIRCSTEHIYLSNIIFKKHCSEVFAMCAILKTKRWKNIIWYSTWWLCRFHCCLHCCLHCWVCCASITLLQLQFILSTQSSALSQLRASLFASNCWTAVSGKCSFPIMHHAAIVIADAKTIYSAARLLVEIEFHTYKMNIINRV